MDVITTTHTEMIVEKKKTTNQKLKEKKRNKKLGNQTNQNVEISSNENCHGIAEAGSCTCPVVDFEKSSQVDKAHTEEIAEKKTKSGKLNEIRRKKNPMCSTNQNIEISSNEKCHVTDGGSCVGPAVESLFKGPSQEDRAPNDTIKSKRTAFTDEVVKEFSKGEKVLSDAVKENSHNETKKRKRKSTRKGGGKNLLVPIDQEHKDLDITNGKSCIRAEVALDVDVVSLVEESPKVDKVLTDIVNEKSQQRKKRSKSKSRATSKDDQLILDQEIKCLDISADKSCISATDSCIKDVDLTVEPLLQESAEVGEVSTEIVKEKQNSEGKQRKKKKSKARNKDGKAILDEEDKCLKISVDSKSCIAEAESGINGVGSTVESPLQESLNVEDVSTEIAKGKKVLGGKRKRKKKSNARNKDGKAILDEEVKCLKDSDDRESCIAAAESGISVVSTVEALLQESPKVEEVSTEIAENQKTPQEKKRRKRKSKDRDTDEKVILGEEDKCLKISAESKGCIAAAESGINGVDLNVESLPQESAVVNEGPTEIVKEEELPGGKRKRKKRSRSKKKVDTKTEMGTLQGVYSNGNCPSDNVPSLVSNGEVDLSNDLYQLPRRAGMTRSRRILLILDINGLLADIVMPPPKERKSDINMLGRAIFKRPYCDDFLNFCFDTFDVGIWSSRTKRVIDKVVDYLLGNRKQKLLFCWDMSHTTISKFKTLENRYKPLVCKSLRNLWEKRDPALPWEKGDYTESNTLLIDDSPYKALLNPMHTAIFPHSFTFKDLHDNLLGPGGEIRVYLQNLAKTDDVRRYVKQHPFGQSAITENSSSWDFYSEVVDSLSQL